MVKLSDKQEEILENSIHRSVVICAAAVGKTTILTEKIRRILKSGVNPKKVVAITFTKMAAEEMRSRLGNDCPAEVFIGTIHAYANRILLMGGIDTRQTLDDEKFDELFPLIEENPECIQEVEWLLLDEAQDSAPDQFSFMFEMINPEHFFVVGDVRQSIYGWNGADPKLIQNLGRQWDVEVFDLNENYRNGRNILQFAKKVLSASGMVDNSFAMRDENGVVHYLEYNAKQICGYIKQKQNYKNWAIVTRTNAQIEEITYALEREGIPSETFKRGNLTLAQLKEKMEKETVKVLTVHTAKGLEWDNVVVIGANNRSKEEVRIGYVAATRARNSLIWTYIPQKKKGYRNWE